MVFPFIQNALNVSYKWDEPQEMFPEEMFPFVGSCLGKNATGSG
jgi:hypothetical protein